MDAVSIASSALSVSDKIRALNDLGMPRAEIARLLGKRYQHVRNVLEADRTTGKARGQATGVAEGERAFKPQTARTVAADGGVFRLDIDADGAIRLPAHALEVLHLRPGGVATACLGAGSIEILGVEESVRRVQSWVRELVPPDVRLSDALIADRRAEAETD